MADEKLDVGEAEEEAAEVDVNPDAKQIKSETEPPKETEVPLIVIAEFDNLAFVTASSASFALVISLKLVTTLCLKQPTLNTTTLRIFLNTLSLWKKTQHMMVQKTEPYSTQSYWMLCLPPQKSLL